MLAGVVAHAAFCNLAREPAAAEQPQHYDRSH